MSSADYWRKRAEQRIVEAEQKALLLEHELSRRFEQAEKNIEAEIAKLYRDFGAASELEYDEVVKKLTRKQKEQFRRDLNYYIEQISEQDPDFAKKLKALSVKARITRLEAVKASIEYEAHKLYKKYLDSELQLLLSDVLEDGYHRTIFDIQQSLGFGVSFTSLSPHLLEAFLLYPWSGKNYSEKIWGQVRRFDDRLGSVLTTGIIQGKSNQEMARDLAKAAGVQYRQALTLVRTETNFVSNAATAAAYDEYGLERYKYLATLDLRTSEICRGLDGQKFAVADKAVGVNYPPMHARCRSTTVPDIGEEDGTRIARRVDGSTYKVPRDMTYQQWYEKHVKTNPKELAAEKMIRNRSADKKQYRNYRDTLGQFAPKKFDDFQQMKYNDGEKWTELKERYRATNHIKSDSQAKNIHIGRQNKHIEGTNAYKQYVSALQAKGQYGPSKLTVTSAEAEKLVRKYAGRGWLDIRNGHFTGSEIILTNDKIVGKVVNNLTGESVETSVFKIHYGSKGVHIVPDYPSKKVR